MHKDMYYNEVMERWFAANGTGLAASSYEKYYRLYANHIRPFFRDVKVSELSEDLLDAYRAELERRRSSRGGELSAGTVRCIAMLANRGICAAREGHMLKEEMRLQANKPGGKEIVQVFTEAEQRRLEQYLRSAMDVSRMGVYLCLYTGLRIGELCSLRWEDVDLETGSICVRKTVQRLRVPAGIIMESVTDSASLLKAMITPVSSFEEANFSQGYSESSSSVILQPIA